MEQNLFIAPKRALLSVSDKTGIVELAKKLVQYQCQIISTGGTGKALMEAGIGYTDISQITGNPEAFDGRMKTISFAIEAALLFDREKHQTEAQMLGIEPIDLVVCNLYPFQKARDENADLPTLAENIDIGGPTMLRAAAKNYQYVAAVTDPNDYPAVIAELDQNNGNISTQTRLHLMRKTFNHTADYDAMIAVALDQQANIHSYRIAFENGQQLRYGENPHQQAWFYRQKNAQNSLFDIQTLHGKPLSFNNIMDMQAAVAAIQPLKKNACAIVKHNNSCGLAQADDQYNALQLAWQGDPISSFGGIIAFNQSVLLQTATFFQLDAKNRSQRKFIEVIVAPNFDNDALQYLQQHKDLRIIKYNNHTPTNDKLQFLDGALLRQTPDKQLLDQINCVTNTQLDTEIYRELIEFGLNAVAQIKSNAIVIVRQQQQSLQLLGMGTGQPNRLVATKLAIEKAIENLNNEIEADDNGNNKTQYIYDQLGQAILISDAFFPFEDNIELAAKYGIKHIIQPGGSIRDQHIINKCNQLNVSMTFTGIRHFKH